MKKIAIVLTILTLTACKTTNHYGCRGKQCVENTQNQDKSEV